GITDPQGERRMNTVELIDILGMDMEPVSSGRFGRMLILAIVTSGAAAFGLMTATVGLRPDLQSPAHLEWLAVQLLFAVSVVGAGVPLLNRSMRLVWRMGRTGRSSSFLFLLPAQQPSQR